MGGRKEGGGEEKEEEKERGRGWRKMRGLKEKMRRRGRRGGIEEGQETKFHARIRALLPNP